MVGLTIPPATSTFPAAPTEKVRLALAALLPLAAPKKAGLALAAIAPLDFEKGELALPVIQSLAARNKAGLALAGLSLAAIPPLAARLAPAAIASWVARKKMGCSKEA